MAPASRALAHIGIRRESNMVISLGAHQGDLPNVTGSANGRGTINFLVSGELQDEDGTSLVIHANPDDYRTDPSGNSGARIACAVLAPPK
jgi:Cu-Zn family superoxide dismutase